MIRKTLAFICLFSMFCWLNAVKVKQIRKDGFADFLKGTLQNASIDGSGKLILGPTYRNIEGPAEEFYLSLAVAKNDDIYIGTGHNAAIYRISAAGKVEALYQGDQLDVYALAVTAGGDVVFGTSPNGRVFRLEGGNKATELFNPEEKFIWDLCEDKQGNIVCAMGNTGAVYSINKSKEVENLFTADDTHIISLAIMADNSILAGSGNSGILYQIKNKKVKILFDSPLEEVRAIALDGEENIYLAVNRDHVVTRVAKDVDGDLALVVPEKNEKSPPPPLEKSMLYCVQKDGTVERVWSSTEEMIYSLYYNPASEALVFGTGDSGRVYAIDKSRNAMLLYESDSAQIFRCAGTRSGFVLIANNPRLLTKVENGTSSTGTYFSDIFDASILSRFGRITWNAQIPSQTSVSFFVRLGNSANPDKSWTTWSAPFTDAENSSVQTAGYRFLQTKIVLGSATPAQTPSVFNYRIYYSENNLKPEIRNLVLKDADERKEATGNAAPVARNLLTFQWEAQDVNGDQLNCNAYLRRLNSEKWILVKKNFGENKLEIDPELYADGKYFLKVVLDDSPDNSPALAKTDSKISIPFIMDSTAPYLRDFKVSGNRVSFIVADDASTVSRVNYSFDGKEWYAVFSDDLILDSRLEKFNFELDGLKNHDVIFIKVGDECRNYKVFQEDL